MAGAFAGLRKLERSIRKSMRKVLSIIEKIFW